MALFVDEYVNLLILQYRNSPKAEATIRALVSKYEELYNVIKSFDKAFDVDTAEGVQLDILGKIVGIPRNVPFAAKVLPKNYFGFSDNTSSAYPMGDKFLTVVAYPFKDRFEIPYTTGQLNDNSYRFFIKAKVVKNVVKAKMIDKNKLSLQDVVDYLFKSKAYVVDNYNMTLNLYINNTFDFSMLQYIKQLDLLPRPQGAGYKTIISYVEGSSFGFGVNNTGFSDKFSTVTKSYFAEKIL
jgi:hypothetical protein